MAASSLPSPMMQPRSLAVPIFQCRKFLRLPHPILALSLKSGAIFCLRTED